MSEFQANNSTMEELVSGIEPDTKLEFTKEQLNTSAFGFQSKVESEPPIPKLSKLQTCVVGISSNHPYDSSKFVNNDTTFYRQISYSQLAELLKAIRDINTSQRPTPSPINQNIIFITECYKQSEIKMIFRFLCSSDCVDGKQFIDTITNNLVYEFVNVVCEHPKCLIEFSDHSLGSFVENWNIDLMGGLSCPIGIKPYRHSGKFTMKGKKSDFVNSAHPTLKQIGDMAGEEDVVITFINMGGTKVYEILNKNIVKLISTGNQLEYDFMSIHIPNNNREIYSTVPVHTEFNYKKGIIVLSSTHWCNLDSVETSIDIPTLRRYCTDSLGIKETEKLDKMLSSAKNEDEIKRAVSGMVRGISSGNST